MTRAELAAQLGASVGWQRRLSKSERGMRPELLNAYLILMHEEAWQGVIALDEFSHRVLKRKPPPYGIGQSGEWTDADDSRTHVWIAEKFGTDIATGTIAEAVQLVAQENRYHPVREYLQRCKEVFLERKERTGDEHFIDHWLLNYLGAVWANDANVKRYIERISRMWLMAAVARVMHPGCKADHAIILEGQQGLGKSSALAILGGEWFSDTPFVIGDKDSYEGLRGVWLKEISELDSYNKAEATKSKAFFSASVDWFRPPYGHRHQAFARQCVFGGTTNQNEYFRDSTGNRRYWPVYCSWFEREELQGDRDVIWGEAMLAYERHLAALADGQWQWWPQAEDFALMAAQQEQREILDPWEALLSGWLLAPERCMVERFTVAEILTECLKVDPGRIDERAMATRVGRCLHKLGWHKRQASTREERAKCRFYYERPVPCDTEAE